jgi:hypothetical protein
MNCLVIVLLTCSWHTGSCGATSHFSKMKSPGLGRPGQRTEEPRGVGGWDALPLANFYVVGGFAVGASSFNRHGSPHSSSWATT